MLEQQQDYGNVAPAFIELSEVDRQRPIKLDVSAGRKNVKRRFGRRGLVCQRLGDGPGNAGLNVRELVRTTDAVLISAIEALLKGAGINHMVVDQNMSIMEGSIGIFPRRILVREDEAQVARRLLEDAGFGSELRPDVR